MNPPTISLRCFFGTGFAFKVVCALFLDKSSLRTLRRIVLMSNVPELVAPFVSSLIMEPCAPHSAERTQQLRAGRWRGEGGQAAGIPNFSSFRKEDCSAKDEQQRDLPTLLLQLYKCKLSDIRFVEESFVAQQFLLEIGLCLLCLFSVEADQNFLCQICRQDFN